MSHASFPGDPVELAALYVAGALTADEHAAFEAHLESCPECKTEVRALDEVALALAGAVAPVVPDPRLRGALLQRLPTALEPIVRAIAAGPSLAPGQPLFIQRAGEGIWEPTGIEGVQMRVLFVDRAQHRFTALMRMAPGASYPFHSHAGPEECYVLEGDLRLGEQVLRGGDYQYAPAGSDHEQQHTRDGCLLLLTTALPAEVS